MKELEKDKQYNSKELLEAFGNEAKEIQKKGKFKTTKKKLFKVEKALNHWNRSYEDMKSMETSIKDMEEGWNQLYKGVNTFLSKIKGQIKNGK